MICWGQRYPLRGTKPSTETITHMIRRVGLPHNNLEAGLKPHKFHNGNTQCFSKRTKSTLFKRTGDSIHILAAAALIKEW